MWDERFQTSKHLYSTEPNIYFKRYLGQKTSGTILLPADGEGRNGVYAAKNGWNVTSFDYSETGIQHANELAEQENVKLHTHFASIETIDFPKASFDIIAIVFLHLPPDIRTKHFPRLTQYLKTGGELYILGFAKEQIDNSSGGPKNIDMLFSPEELAKDFKSLKILRNQPFTDIIDEGPKHQGKANLIEFIGVK